MGGLFSAVVLVGFVANRFRPVEVGALPGERSHRQSRWLIVTGISLVAMFALVYRTDGAEQMAFYAGYGPGLWVAIALLRLVGRRATWLVRSPKAADSLEA